MSQTYILIISILPNIPKRKDHMSTRWGRLSQRCHEILGARLFGGLTAPAWRMLRQDAALAGRGLDGWLSHAGGHWECGAFHWREYETICRVWIFVHIPENDLETRLALKKMQQSLETPQLVPQKSLGVQAMTAIPPQTSLTNMCTYFHPWPKHRPGGNETQKLRKS